LGNQFTPNDLCDETHKQRFAARVQALLETRDDSPLERVRPCDMQKLIKALKLTKAVGLVALRMNASGAKKDHGCTLISAKFTSD
jgi:hypothetical protein